MSKLGTNGLQVVSRHRKGAPSRIAQPPWDSVQLELESGVAGRICGKRRRGRNGRGSLSLDIGLRHAHWQTALASRQTPILCGRVWSVPRPDSGASLNPRPRPSPAGARSTAALAACSCEREKRAPTNVCFSSAHSRPRTVQILVLGHRSPSLPIGGHRSSHGRVIAHVPPSH